MMPVSTTLLVLGDPGTSLDDTNTDCIVRLLHSALRSLHERQHDEHRHGACNSLSTTTTIKNLSHDNSRQSQVVVTLES